jgi:ATP-dependent DNA helicase RecQ
MLLSAPIREMGVPSQSGRERRPSVEKPLSEGQEMAMFNQLRELRTRLARKEGRPAYCIFQDRTLREMARRLPETRDELIRIVGVGEVTLEKYGRQFLELIGEIKGDQ